MRLESRSVPTTAFSDQKQGTSGLRKKVSTVKQEHYLENFLQSYYLVLKELHGDLGTRPLIIGGDGRYYNRTAITTAIQIGAANGVKTFWVPKGGLISTPAASAVIREKPGEDNNWGAILFTASHNPGGPDADFGVKFNTPNGAPATEDLTHVIHQRTLTIQEYKIAEEPSFNIDTIGNYEYKGITIEVFDPVDCWLGLMKVIFDFDALRKLTCHPEFSFVYDAMNGVAGIYAKRLFVEELGLPESCLLRCCPLEDFGGIHPDPNMTYAAELVEIMGIGVPRPISTPPVFGAAGDGDNDRNMILGSGVFVNPSDSLAIITEHAQTCIPYFRKGVVGVARSMPTSSAVDAVARSLKCRVYVVPTGWKYFADLMDKNLVSICGEESFGTGSNHIREKDGLWAVLAWLSILEFFNRFPRIGSPFIGVDEIQQRHWKKFGRFFYNRLDYEDCNEEDVELLWNYLEKIIATVDPSVEMFLPEHAESIKTILGDIKRGSKFRYQESKLSLGQGLMFLFTKGIRVVLRKSGTGSSGVTVRIYLEKFGEHTSPQLLRPSYDVLKPVAEQAILFFRIEEYISRTAPTVLT